MTLPSLASLTRQQVIRLHDLTANRAPRASALDVAPYNHGEATKPVDKMRWTVARFEWTGNQWRRVDRLTGPMRFEDAARELERHSKRTGIPPICDA